jgi:hypothetical protein
MYDLRICNDRIGPIESVNTNHQEWDREEKAEHHANTLKTCDMEPTSLNLVLSLNQIEVTHIQLVESRQPNHNVRLRATFFDVDNEPRKARENIKEEDCCCCSCRCPCEKNPGQYLRANESFRENLSCISSECSSPGRYPS